MDGMVLAAQPPTAHAAALVVFMLIFARVGGAVVAAPILSEKAIPPQVKIGLSAIFAGILTPGQIPLTTPVSADPASFAILIAEQILLGLAFALVFTAIFIAGESAGELIGQQVGITLSTWTETGGNSQMHSFGQIYHIIAGLIFLGLDGQHWVLLGLGASLNSMPVTHVSLSPNLVGVLMSMGTASLEFAVGLALPLLVTLLLADLITGLLGRAMPALNMFVIGLPLKVALALSGVFIAAPFTIVLLTQYMQHIPTIQLW